MAPGAVVYDSMGQRMQRTKSLGYQVSIALLFPTPWFHQLPTYLPTHPPTLLASQHSHCLPVLLATQHSAPCPPINMPLHLLCLLTPLQPPSYSWAWNILMPIWPWSIIHGH